MKNRYLVIGVLLILVILVSVTGCKKDLLNGTDFKSKMESNNYNVTDITSGFNSEDGILECFKAVNNTESIQIEYYKLKSVAQAVYSYQNNKTKFVDSIKTKSLDEEEDKYNYSKYMVAGEGKYMIVSRIENTLVYVSTSSSNIDEVDRILESIGY